DSTVKLNYVVISFEQDTKGQRYRDIAEKKIACIIFFEKTKERFLYLYNDIDTAQYRKLTIGSFSVYLK
ncbi:MAG: hypothetical protein ABIW34_06820, partial [Ginsengibacter sp.]